MKKILVLVMTIILMVPAVLAANPEKQLVKAREKERKEVMKRLKKEGWQLLGSTRSLEVELLTHWNKLDQAGEDGHEVSGISTRSKSKNVGIQMSTNNACINYAQEAGSSLEGQIIADMSGSGTDVDKEFENFYAAYKRGVEKEIRGEMEKSFSLIKENPDGTFEVQTFFIVNESAASKARMRALENALKESEIAQEHAQKIADFVTRNK